MTDQLNNGWTAEIERLRAENARLREALRPFSRLETPNRPQGNAGAYVIQHSDIKRARATLGVDQ